jgi:hypothetical protein
MQVAQSHIIKFHIITEVYHNTKHINKFHIII